MSSPSLHPRRRAHKTLIPSIHSMPLRQHNTFHERVHNAGQPSPLEQAQYMPRRSLTSTKSLEDLVREYDLVAQKQRDVEKLLQQFDDKINGLVDVEGDGSILKDEDVLAIPTFMVQQAIVPDVMDVDQKPANIGEEHHHASDSGLGSSVASSIGNDSHRSAQTSKSISSTSTAITRSVTALGVAAKAEHLLSKDAVRHIKKHIVQPILDEATLKDFHPLVEDIPRRIGAKFITNLRDLEKTLFFLAPDFAPSPRSYLKFCETSIECLHTTVDYLSERDQRLPTDRPYTNNYFLDLVEQIRRYAEIMARTRERENSGQALDEMDYSPTEEIIIQGGLSKNGKPAELVRKKDGKLIPLSESSHLNEEGSTSTFKRHLTDAEMEEEDDVHRSMARRRKSEKPGDVMHPCAACDKEFKRPCDLTKHEKTHSRPWKCSEPKCRYAEVGWPTEKERDRHVNDKHSSAPRMYRCKFAPCSYSSKRESNCKQHMEKTHNWNYVRSKANGRVRKPTATPSEPPTPFMGMTTPGSLSNQYTSPASSLMPSPPTPLNNHFNFGAPFNQSCENLFDLNARRESIATSASIHTFSSGFSPVQAMSSAFEDALLPTPEDLTFNMDYLDATITQTNFSMPTPALSLSHDCDTVGGFAGVEHISPHGQANMTLYTPQANDMTHFDEALGNDMAFGGNFGADFTLFDATPANQTNQAQSFDGFMAMPDMGTIGGQFSYGYDEFFGQTQ